MSSGAGFTGSRFVMLFPGQACLTCHGPDAACMHVRFAYRQTENHSF